jgi:hypothetical protein
MSVKQSSAYCHVCGRQSLFQKPRINHVLHLILSIVTLGLWLFVWAILGIINSGKQPRCTTCGATPGTGPIHAAQPPPTASAAPPVGPTLRPSGPPDPTRTMTSEPASGPVAGCRQCGAEFQSWEEGLEHAGSTHGLDRDSPEAASSLHRY